jgi:hypothetical protein
LKVLNRQSEIHTATDFAFESGVFLHSDVERDCGASRIGLFARRIWAAPLVLKGSAIPLLPAKARSSGLAGSLFGSA